MSVSWTREQQQAIEYHGGNLLVSAAAGSGKTAVLVERIIRMVTDEKKPIDIDQLLVMTFTNAAAAEMRSRIGAAIEKKLEENPDDEHLQMQLSLVHYAKITTIDSFCLSLIRTYFNRLELDPAFRIGDEGELMLLRQDVMSELLEDYYTKDQGDFEAFVNTYATGKSDAGIEDLILRVYTFAQSNPYPALWLEKCRQELENLDPENLDQESHFEALDWVRFLCDDLKRQTAELALQIESAWKVCEQDDILNAYVPMLLNDQKQLKQISEEKTLKGVLEKISGLHWDTLARVRSKEVDAEKKLYVTSCRDRAKKAVKKMQELYAFAPFSEMIADMVRSEKPIYMLLELAGQFMIRYQDKKRERNLVDFNDLEHEALKILIEQDEQGIPRMKDGSYEYTEVADELSQQYAEVLVDEYQDSNLVQEALIQAISGERFGRPNVFMVGDVKQSIYKFRLACPELFLQKYHSYVVGEEAGPAGRMIELHQNFRSRSQVLEGINDIFFRIMTENMGGIRYTEETSLHPCAVFADMEGDLPEEPELLIADTGKDALAELDEEASDLTSREIEGHLIVKRIKELTNPETGLKVWDKNLGESGAYRTAQYRDIVILLRSTADWTETFLSVLMNENIPAYAESRMGYFNTIEVETVLSMLAVIDNPMQDIPLAAVLRSPMVGFSNEELAHLMCSYRKNPEKGQDRGIYAAMHFFLKEESEECEGSEKTEVPAKQLELRNRLKKFELLLLQLRKESTYLPIHELIYHVYERTGYYHYACALPAGQTRRANLDMLVEKAAAYEKTSYKGLFHFIRYIENLKKYDADFGEASTAGAEDNTVRIMSIHKSKGLEFPIVILAGVGKKFNKQDVYSRILVSSDYGIATDYLNLEYRVKASTLKKNALRRKMELDNLGEELRVLYVALTRAKEKLIMTGTDRYLSKTLEKYGSGMTELVNGQLPYTLLSAGNSYLDWLIMSICAEKSKISIVQSKVEELVLEEADHQVAGLRSRELLEQANLETVFDDAVHSMLEMHMNAHYPYESDIYLHSKMSVSELKKQNQPEVKHAEKIISEGSTSGAERGTAYHRVLELLPFSRVKARGDIDIYLDQFVSCKKMSQENRDCINTDQIWNFLKSDLGMRMAKADAEGTLHKEQQFVLGVPACEMGDYDSDELVVVQGIIDAYFEENGELILVDYKTDKVFQSQILLDRYQVQLDYYGRALSQMTEKKVKEKVIYSLTLQKEISVSN